MSPIMPPRFDDELSLCDSPKDMFTLALQEDDVVSELYFENAQLDEGIFKKLELRQCRFVCCRFSDCDFEGISIGDCIFDRCDMSNCTMYKASLRRVVFDNCKLVGTNLSVAFLQDVSFETCMARYINLNGAKMQNVAFCTCDLSSSGISNCSLKQVSFDKCDMSRSEVFLTLFKGLDLSSSNIDGISIAGHELKGTKVNYDQAAQLGRLLAGIVIV